ncbi:hypothetical protein GJ744_002119 [Endocarpon pusillum]|uniref:Heterokaryon incompatibility domain-containing protein n=1 Tax=Endocarpon pusillum TaxID=364733 RepID=A0A8H7A9C1_9EURO|nr:hypothetical protein GJ744_002119 [Endocarpon pusillum]
MHPKLSREVTLANLRRTAEGGCLRCSLLLGGIEEFKHVWNLVELSEDAISIGILPRFNDVLCLSVVTKILDVLHLEYFSCKDDCNLFPEFFPAGEVPESSVSDATFANIKLWIRDCRSRHDLCSSTPNSTIMPTRLVGVGLDNNSLSLRCGSDLMGLAYTALSHSWGNKQERVKPVPKTSRANIQARQQKIPWDDLTKTFQDVVTITRRLGYKAVWIDALCIIQDDELDWAVEASRMAINYENATLVIAASASRTGDDGCLLDREGSRKVVRINSEGRLVSVYVKRPIPHHSSFFPQQIPAPKYLPLFQRAWVFQERLLATRVIHYTQHELVWECKTSSQCECQGMNSATLRYILPKHRVGEVKRNQAEVLKERRNVCERYRQWYEIIQAYSACLLAFDSDRLPALSGIASQIQLPEMGQYMAGIWENAMPRALLWDCSLGKLPRRPSKYRAPSWSWVSVEAHIGPWVPQDSEGVEDVCQILNMRTELVSQDPYGQVHDGFIRLKAPSFAATLQCAKKEQGFLTSHELQYSLVFHHNDHIENLNPDVPLTYGPSQLPGDSLVLIALIVCIDHSEKPSLRRPDWRTDPDVQKGYIGLVMQLKSRLKQENGKTENVYERVGRVGIKAQRIEFEIEKKLQEIVII